MVDTTYYLDEGSGGSGTTLPCGDPGTAACYDVGDAPDQLLTKTMIIALINSMLGGGIAGTVKKLSFITESQTYSLGPTTNKVLVVLVGAGGGGGYMLMGGGGGGLLIGLRDVSAGADVSISVGQGGAGGIDGSGTARHGKDGGQTSAFSLAVTGGRGGHGYGLYSSLGSYGIGGGVYTPDVEGILWAKAGGSTAPESIADNPEKLYVSTYGASPLGTAYGLPYTDPLITFPGSVPLAPGVDDYIAYFGQTNWYGTPPGKDGIYGSGGGAGTEDVGWGGGKGGDGIAIVLELE
jgi:hypothetical protein